MQHVSAEDSGVDVVGAGVIDVVGADVLELLPYAVVLVPYAVVVVAADVV